MHRHLILKLEIVVIFLQSALCSLSSSGPSFQPTSKLPSKHPSICLSSTTAITVMPSKTLTNIPSKPSSRPSIKPTYISTLRPSSSRQSSNPLPLTKKPSSFISSAVTTTSPSNRPLTTPSSKPTCTRCPSAALPTGKPTCTRSPSVTISVLPSIKPSCTRSYVPTISPSCRLSSIPSYVPSTRPTLMPSLMPTTLSPSYAPSTRPTPLPSSRPTTLSPSYAPSKRPTLLPFYVPTTVSPSYSPSTRPTPLPSSRPTTVSPSYAPSKRPTLLPFYVPTTVSPSYSPSTRPTPLPSSRPTTVSPSYAPSTRPTVSPCTPPPTILPTWIPTLKPRYTSAPLAPSNAPTFLKPSVAPSKVSPSVKSTIAPSKIPTILPTVIRSSFPSKKPSVPPSPASTYFPSIFPTAIESVCPSWKPSVPSTWNPSATLSIAPTEVAISKRSVVHAIVPEGYTTEDGIDNADGKLFSSVASFSLAFDVTYHGGSFMSGNVNLYNIYYGTDNSRALLDYLATHIDSSSWYSTMRHYSAGGVSISGPVTLAASVVVTKGLLTRLTDNAVVNIIIGLINTGKLSADENGIYAFIFKGNLRYNGWLEEWCGFHSAFIYNFEVYKFMVLGDSSFSSIGINCQGYFDGPTVNNNVGADSAASVYAHELVETVSNPRGDAFYADTPAGMQENADLCSWSWGMMLPGFDNANVVIGNKNFLIQQNWLPGTGCVSGDGNTFAPTEFPTVSPSSGPSMPPVSSLKPSSLPTGRPSRSKTPSKIPSIIPTSLPTVAPISTVTPTLPRPSALPTIVIPSLQCATLNSVPGCSSATSISIPYTVLSITSTAFSGASQLKLVYMPATVTSIQMQAFQQSAVATVYFSAGLVVIESNAFYGCKSLITVDLSSCTSLQTLGSQAFRETGLISVVLPASLTIVSVYCFCNAVNLVTLQVLPAPSGSGHSGSSLVTIDENSFSGCSSLTAVDLSPCSGLLTVGPYAFSTAGLTSIVLPASPNLVVSNYAFYNAARLSWVRFVAPVPAVSAGNARIGSYSFAGCASLTSVSLSSVVAYVSDYAFYSLTKLTSVNCSYPAPLISTNAFQNAAVTGCTGVLSPIPTSPPSIIFAPGSTRQPTNAPTSLACATKNSPGCSTAASISIPYTVSSIASDAFSYDSSLKFVYMPATVTYIQTQAFRGSSVTAVYFSAGLVTIDDYAFYQCIALKSVDLSPCTSLKTLGVNTFRESGLISVILPASLNLVSDSCFYSITSMVTVRFLSPSAAVPSGNTRIATNAFRGCTSLTTVTFSSAVTYVADDAFYLLASLVDVTCSYPPPQISTYAFEGSSANADTFCFPYYIDRTSDQNAHHAIRSAD